MFQNLFTNIKSNAGYISMEGHGGVLTAADSLPKGLSFTDEDKPLYNQIKREPLLAIERGELVMAVDHVFDSIPSWVEWIPEHFTIRIAEMNGTVNEARVTLKQEHLGEMMARRKILTISNEPDKGFNAKIMHYIPFLSR